MGGQPAARLSLACLLLVSAACASSGAPAAEAPQPTAADSAPPRSTAPTPGTATADDWRGMATGRTEELFVGRFPGVRVLRLPNGALSIRVRGGGGSFYGNNEPLIVIDGTPIEPGAGGLNGINPADIQKIEVLRDVAATTFYGVRGGNGVVLITTKRRSR